MKSTSRLGALLRLGLHGAKHADKSTLEHQNATRRLHPGPAGIVIGIGHGERHDACDKG